MPPNSAIAASTRIPTLRRLLNLFYRLKGGEKDFSHALGLTSDDRLKALAYHKDDYGHTNLTLRCKLQSELLLGNRINLSTYLAILDDVTTWALIADRPKHIRPGVSVNFRMAWGQGMEAGNAVNPDTSLDIAATVVKSGRNLGFIRAEVRETDSGKLICHGAHTKFLPVGMLGSLALTPLGVWLMGVYAEWKDGGGKEKEYEIVDPPPLRDVFDSLQFQSDHLATFTALPHHSSGGGVIHGGCQALLMELVGERAAQVELGSKNVHLELMDLMYVSSARKHVEIEASVISRLGPQRASLRVRLKRSKGGDIISEGTLTFSTCSSDSGNITAKL